MEPIVAWLGPRRKPGRTCDDGRVAGCRDGAARGCHRTSYKQQRSRPFSARRDPISRPNAVAKDSSNLFIAILSSQLPALELGSF